jgi:amidase
MSEKLWQMDAVEIARGIRGKKFSCVEVMQSVVERIRALNPRLNAIVTDLTDRALKEANEADRRGPGPEAQEPLFGVPITIKVNVDVEGQANTNGVTANANVIAPADSPVVRNLKRAGAIIVGRTNTPEFSLRFTTTNPLHGRTLSPWHPEASPGGSSGGAGAAAAAGFGAIHHGNDIGGSLRAPAFTNGVVTVKPTQGRMAAYNPSATSERWLLSHLTSVQGAIARSVADVRLGTRVMAGRDPRDPWWVPAPFEGEPLPKPIRVAVTKNAHGYAMHRDIAQLIDQAAAHLSAAGYEVAEVEPPPITEPARGWMSVLLTELKASYGASIEQNGSEEIRHLFDWYCQMGTLLDFTGYLKGLADKTRMMREWNLFLERYPLVLTPYLMRPTFAWNYDAAGPAQARDLWDAAIYSYGINYLALPAGMLPMGLVDALPAGIQIVGRRFREDTILDAMAAVEARTGRLTPQLWERDM